MENGEWRMWDGEGREGYYRSRTKYAGDGKYTLDWGSGSISR